MKSNFLTIFLAFICMVLFSPSINAQTYEPDVTAPSKSITVDGDLSDWANVPSHSLGLSTDGTQISGENDFTAYYKVAYDENHLYFIFDVADDEAIIYKDGNTLDIWAVDNLELFLDMDNSKATSIPDYSKNVSYWQIRLPRGVEVVPGKSGWPNGLGTMPTVPNSPGSTSAFNHQRGWVEGFNMKRVEKETETGYILEIGIPWSVLTHVDADLSAEDFTPGTVIGFAAQLTDEDDTDASTNSRMHSNPDHAWNNPSTWGTITLGDDAPSFESATILKVPASESVAIDGKIDGVWMSDGVNAHKFGSLLEGPGLVAPENDADFMPTWKALWTDTALIVMIEAKDQTVWHRENAMWAMDRIEIYLHFGDSSISEGASNIWSQCNNGFWQVPLQVDTLVTEGGTGCFTAGPAWDNIVYNFTNTPQGYILEASLPWDVFTKGDSLPIDPAAGFTFEMDILAQDNDQDTVVAGDANERTMMYWVSNRHLFNADWDTVGMATLSAQEAQVPAPQTETIMKVPAGTEITIDGQTGDIWSNPAFSSNQFHSLHKVGWNLITPESEADFMPTWKAAWNDTALFVLVEVKDDKIVRENTWSDDAIELYFHFGDSAIEEGASNIWSQCRKGYHQVPLKVDSVIYGGGTSCMTDGERWDKVTYAVTKTTEGYILEASLPWEVFTGGDSTVVDMEAGDMFEMDLMAQDNDQDTSIHQHARTNWYWSSRAHLFNADWSQGVGQVTLSDESIPLPKSYTETIKKVPAGTEITIDGKMGDLWNDPSFEANEFNSLHEVGWNLITPESEADFMPAWKAAWNDTALFVLVEVKDDKIVRENTWSDDAIELYFHFGDSAIEEGASNIWSQCRRGYHQVPLKVDSVIYAGGTSCMTAGERWEKVTYAVSTTTEGYVLEASLPWSIFTGGDSTAIDLEAGDTFEMDIMAQDNDQDTSIHQHARTNWYWSSRAHLFNADWSQGVGQVTLSSESLEVPEKQAATLMHIPTTAEINIDGLDYDFWSDDPIMFNEFTALQRDGWRLDKPESEADLMPKWKAAWNDTAIFVFLKVVDDKVYGQGKWSDDAVELYFHFGDSAIEEGASNIWSQCRQGYHQVPLRVPTITKSGGTACMTAGDRWEKVQYAVARTPDGYQLEAALPWDIFTDGDSTVVNPGLGDSFEMDVHVQDNDNEGADHTRTSIYWSSQAHLFNADWSQNVGMVTLKEYVDIALDGEIDPIWSTAPALWINKPVTPDNLAPHNVTDADDLSGYYKVRWDEDYLYALAVIKDDTLINAGGHNTDNVSMAIDPNNLKDQADPGVISVVAKYGVTDLSGYERPGWGNPPYYEFVVNEKDFGYIAEFKIPADSVRIDMLEVGKMIGWDVLLNDVDDAVTPNRDLLSWNFPLDQQFEAPYGYGTLELVANGNVVGYRSPDSIKNVNVEITNEVNATVTWDSIPGVDGYYIVSNLGSAGDGTTINYVTTITGSTSNSYTFENLSEGLYTYAVMAYSTGDVRSVPVWFEFEIVIIDVADHLDRKLRLYPNPAGELLNIEGEQISKIQVSDLAGRIISLEEFRTAVSTATINISDLSSGMYIVTIRTNDVVVTREIIKK